MVGVCSVAGFQASESGTLDANAEAHVGEACYEIIVDFGIDNVLALLGPGRASARPGLPACKTVANIFGTSARRRASWPPVRKSCTMPSRSTGLWQRSGNWPA